MYAHITEQNFLYVKKLYYLKFIGYKNRLKSLFNIIFYLKTLLENSTRKLYLIVDMHYRGFFHSECYGYPLLFIYT